ncbi:sulfite exporter TauE/SafE family protein [Jongsikchunia kroppenstedtii]|uniref:sulfite exporter TauE/SafE family protein n=1 Tax=Jongsikchunia kroppenstedtii TaxID=1121721 RepID=UPI00035E6087|nr:sulfite exporter TauE/SafE family protein [Jongsikchunia kroppenstedtii]
MHGLTEWSFLAGCGVVAGIIGTAGGITSLVAYPALLATGISPLAANVTNSVALLGSGVGSALRAGPDLSGRAAIVRRWLPLTATLSLAGAAMLVLTPAGIFDWAVPFLVMAGAVTVLVQPWLTRRRNYDAQPHPAAGVAGAGVGLYNGYFGAGAGILFIALMLSTSEPVPYRANSLKNVILVVSDVAPAVLFAVLGTVIWQAVWPLSIGSLVGGLIGPTLARALPAPVMRMFIGACGFALAGWLLVRAAR